MFKILFVAAMVALSAAKPGLVAPLAYSSPYAAYSAPYAAYSSPVAAAYTAPLAYSAYSAYPAYSAYSYASPYSSYYYR